jgi:hypothetical protein
VYWLALLFVAPLNVAVVVNEPSAVVVAVTTRVADEPPGGIKTPFK